MFGTSVDKLDKICRDRGIYPGAVSPGFCWIMENVLRIDPTWVVADGVTLKGCWKMVPDIEGKRRYDPKTLELIKEWHEWTDEELDLLIEWQEFVPKWIVE